MKQKHADSPSIFLAAAMAVAGAAMLFCAHRAEHGNESERGRI
mgnify:CR=1 FL=1